MTTIGVRTSWFLAGYSQAAHVSPPEGGGWHDSLLVELLADET